MQNFFPQKRETRSDLFTENIIKLHPAVCKQNDRFWLRNDDVPQSYKTQSVLNNGRHIQGDPGGMINMLRRDSVGHCKKKNVRMNVSDQSQ